MIANQNFSMMAGDTLPVVVNVVDSLGTPFNFTGYTLACKIREYDASGLVVVTKTTASGITATSGGVVTISLAAADTATLAGTYYIELEATCGTNVYTVTYGWITILRTGV